MYAYLSSLHGSGAHIAWTWRTMLGGEEQYFFGLLDHDGEPSRKLPEFARIAREAEFLSRKHLLPCTITPGWPFPTVTKMTHHPVRPGLLHHHPPGTGAHGLSHAVPPEYSLPGSRFAPYKRIVRYPAATWCVPDGARTGSYHSPLCRKRRHGYSVGLFGQSGRTQPGLFNRPSPAVYPTCLACKYAILTGLIPMCPV